MTEGMNNNVMPEGMNSNVIPENKTKNTSKDTSSLSDYLEVTLLVISIILLVGGIIYLLCTFNGIGYFNYTYKGYWGFLDFLISIVALAVGGVAMIGAEEYRKMNLRKH